MLVNKNTIKAAVAALAGLVETHGQPSQEAYQAGRAALYELRALLNRDIDDDEGTGAENGNT